MRHSNPIHVRYPNNLLKVITSICNPINIEFKLKNKIFDNRNFILRVYPDNNNIKKPSNEAKRLREIQNLKIPKAKIYFFEKNLKHLGYRFLILEKLEGTPILESISKFSEAETKQFLADLARFLGTLHSIRSKSYDSYYLELSSQNIDLNQLYVYSEAEDHLISYHTLTATNIADKYVPFNFVFADYGRLEVLLSFR